jgi:hypothetical protein
MVGVRIGTVRKYVQPRGLMAAAAVLICFGMIFLFGAVPAQAQVAVMLEEPFGGFGAFNPTGHAAIYLARVCMETPTHLRRCRPGELGVVISRYHRVAGKDWIGVPLIPYLYAVDTLSEVPATASVQTEDVLRDAWRREHLEALVPNVPGPNVMLAEGDASGVKPRLERVSDSTGETAVVPVKSSADVKKISDSKASQDRPTAIELADGTPPGEWYQLTGSAYDRKLFGFELDTTAAQDDAFIKEWNARKNKAHFNLLFRNCADFSRNVLDFYFPGSVRRNWIADVGIMTPKQVARSVVKYGRKHPELHLEEFEVPQVPGSIARSHRPDGTIESIVKSKKYVIPLAVINPYVAGTLVAVWAVEGRFSVPSDAPVMKQLDVPGANAGRKQLKIKPDGPSAAPITPPAGTKQAGDGE